MGDHVPCILFNGWSTKVAPTLTLARRLARHPRTRLLRLFSFETGSSKAGKPTIRSLRRTDPSRCEGAAFNRTPQIKKSNPALDTRSNPSSLLQQRSASACPSAG